ncbi:hypothetical protein ACHAQH_008309 [Verticillium albo-atrum]
MATPWPDEHSWPTPFREHAAKLSRYLQTALQSIDNANGQPIEPQSVRVAFMGALTLLAKLQNIPDLDNIRDAIANLHTETKTASEKAVRATTTLREELSNANRSIQQNATDIKDNTAAARAANTVAKEALEANKMTLKMVRDAKALGPMNPGSIAHTYASIIVNIRDPITIASLRAMGPRSLKAHIDRAIEQSNNENIDKLKAASAN